MPAWLILSFSLLIAPVRHQEQPPPQKESPPPETPYIERGQRHFNFYPGGKLEVVAGTPGSLKVIGWKRASVLVEMERIVRGLSMGQAKALAERFPIHLRWTQTLGSLRTIGPPAGTVDTEFNLTIYVPKDKTDVYIQILKGNLAIGAVNGWIEATLQEGSIEAKSISGYFSGNTKRGDLSVELAGKRWEGHSFTAVTQKGAVDLRLPVDYSAALQLETRDGNIAIDFPEQMVDGESIPLAAVVKKNARTLAAKVGEGGAAIRLMTIVGDIRLSKAVIPNPD